MTDTKGALASNPPDCICEYAHASCTYCPSVVPSRGAVPDADRSVMRKGAYALGANRRPAPLMCVCQKCYPLKHALATQEDLLCDCCGGRCDICRLSCEEHRRQSEARHA